MSKRSGFTLIELVASIALVLILILGINQVFSIASKGVGAGQALSTAQRDNRTAHSVIYTDLRNFSADGPFFIIKSERVAAFRNATEASGDFDYAGTEATILTADVDGDNSEAGVNDQQPPTSLSARNHRVDQIRFFSRNLYRRQTGDPGVFVSPSASTEAYIVYGHLMQPNVIAAAGPDFTTSQAPGLHTAGVTATTNSNNFYAQQFILGRNVSLMRQPELETGQLVINDANGFNQYYHGRDAAAPATSLSPFSGPTPATNNGTAFDTNWPASYGRYDLIGMNFQQASQIITTAIATRPPPADWFDILTFRYAGWPYPTKPHTSQGLAQTASTFIQGCSQFAVEYAGDFLTQPDPMTGIVTAVGADGEIDYVPIFNGVGQPVIKRVRWYGFPRNVDTSDDDDPAAPGGVRVRGAGAGGGALAGGVNLIDVVPLRDVILTIAGGPGESAPFERRLNPAEVGGSRLPAQGNYARTLALGAEYICAWGPPGTFVNWAGAPVPDPAKPRMLRFTMGVDDPQGRLAEQQLYEYVVELP